jgi:hypothetical protein
MSAQRGFPLPFGALELSKKWRGRATPFDSKSREGDRKVAHPRSERGSKHFEVFLETCRWRHPLCAADAGYEREITLTEHQDNVAHTDRAGNRWRVSSRSRKDPTTIDKLSYISLLADTMGMKLRSAEPTACWRGAGEQQLNSNPVPEVCRARSRASTHRTSRERQLTKLIPQRLGCRAVASQDLY